MISGCLIREARGLLGWAVWRLAKQVESTPAYVVRVEAADGTPSIPAKKLQQIKAVLEDAGIEFFVDDSGQVALRLRKLGRR